MLMLTPRDRASDDSSRQRSRAKRKTAVSTASRCCGNPATRDPRRSSSGSDSWRLGRPPTAISSERSPCRAVKPAGGPSERTGPGLGPSGARESVRQRAHALRRGRPGSTAAQRGLARTRASPMGNGVPAANTALARAHHKARSPQRLRTLSPVAGGGVIGTARRLALDLVLPHSDRDFPLDTLLINLLGSCALGCLAATFLAHHTSPDWLRPGLSTGVIGSFTTFSAVPASLLTLVRNGEKGGATLYLAASLCGGLVAAVLGHEIGARLRGYADDEAERRPVLLRPPSSRRCSAPGLRGPLDATS